MIAIDESDFPLVVVRVEGTYSDDELRQAIAVLERLVQSGKEPYALLFDMRQAEVPSSLQLRMGAASFRQNEEAMAHKLVGLVFVVRHPAVVAAIESLFEMRPVPVPHLIEDRLSRARAWARARMSEILV